MTEFDFITPLMLLIRVEDLGSGLKFSSSSDINYYAKTPCNYVHRRIPLQDSMRAILFI